MAVHSSYLVTTTRVVAVLPCLVSCLVIGCAGSDGESTTTIASTTGSTSGDSEGSGDTDPTTTEGTSGTTGGSATEATGTTEGSTGGVCELDLELDLDLGVLADHIADLQEVSTAVSSGASDLKPAGFLAAPGYSEKVLIALAEPLDQACEEASVLEPVCEDDEARCWQVACTGDGARWSLTTWVNQIPAQAGDYTFSELAVTVSSVEVAGSFDFQISSLATKGPATWGVTANGSILEGDFDVVILLPELVEEHETVLIASGTKGSFGGQLEVDNVPVATVNGDGTLTPMGGCW